jgi:hypothetical protein
MDDGYEFAEASDGIIAWSWPAK